MSRAGSPHGKKEDHMIETAIQKGSYVYVYGQGNRSLFSCPGELHGFTSATVSVRRGSYVYTYDARGHVISSHYAK